MPQLKLMFLETPMPNFNVIENMWELIKCSHCFDILFSLFKNKLTFKKQFVYRCFKCIKISHKGVCSY